MTIDGEAFTDSASILSAIEATFTAAQHAPLLPRTDAASDERAAFEAAERLEARFFNAWLVWLTTPPWLPGDDGRRAEFTAALNAIDSHLKQQGTRTASAGGGPYLLGAKFSLADVKLAPAMERAAASMPFYRGVLIRTGGRWPGRHGARHALRLTALRRLPPALRRLPPALSAAYPRPPSPPPAHLPCPPLSIGQLSTSASATPSSTPSASSSPSPASPSSRLTTARASATGATFDCAAHPTARPTAGAACAVLSSMMMCVRAGCG